MCIVAIEHEAGMVELSVLLQLSLFSVDIANVEAMLLNLFHA